MKTAPASWDKWVTLDNMSQVAHFFAACFVVEHFGRWGGHPGLWLFLVTILAGFKEACLDPMFESEEVAGNGWKDWSSFTVGALAGFLLARC